MIVILKYIYLQVVCRFVATYRSINSTQADTYFQLGQPEGWFSYEYCHRGMCTWNISTEVGQAIMLSVERFYMTCVYYAGDCACGSLEIFDGSEILTSRMIYRKCFSSSYYNPGLLTSIANNMIVVFRVNPLISRGYFTAFYKSVNSTYVVRDCGGILLGLDGNLSTPGYPNSYSNLLDCEWIITVEPPYKVWLHIQDLDLETSRMCQYDSIQIFDGNNGSSDRLALYCYANPYPSTVVSSNTSLFIKFVSNWNVTKRGFKARWVAVCRQDYYGNNCGQTCNCSNNTLVCDNVNGTCRCKEGWEGVQCEIDINECTKGLHNCTYDHANCTNTNGSYRCDCLAGYLHTTNASCTECTPNYYGENCNQTCNCSNKTLYCDNVNGTCKCKAGWEGVQCEMDINECTKGLHNCTYKNDSCTNTNGSYRCDCLAGYAHSTNLWCAEADTSNERPIAIVVAPIIVGVALIVCAALIVYAVRKYTRRTKGNNVNNSMIDMFPLSFNGDESTAEYAEINHYSLGDHDKDGSGRSNGDNQNLKGKDTFLHFANSVEETETYAEINLASFGDHYKEGSATIQLSLDYGRSAKCCRVKDKSNIGTSSAAKDTEKPETVPSEDANDDRHDKMKESKPQICRMYAHSDTSGKKDYLLPTSSMPLLDEVASPENSVINRPEEEDKHDYYLHPISNDSCL